MIRVLSLLLVAATVGCVGSTQPTAAPSSPPSASAVADASGGRPSLSPGASPTVPTTSLPALAATLYFQIPQHPRGRWVPRALLDDHAVLLSLIPHETATPEQRSSFTSELARFETRSGEVRTLLRHAPGKQAVSPKVAGSSVAWIEATADLRAYGWAIHLTDIRSGQDKVVASDSGFHPEGVSVLPALGYDGTRLVYTTAGGSHAEPVWELHRVGPEADQVIATLPRIRDQRFLSLAVDETTVTWSENVTNPDPHTKIGVYDLRNRIIVKRAATRLQSVYTIAFTGQKMYYATGEGVFESDRTLSSEPTPFSSDPVTVDSIAVAAGQLFYAQFDAGQTVWAADTSTRTRVRIGQEATLGPVTFGTSVMWFERSSSAGGARLAIAKLAGT